MHHKATSQPEERHCGQPICDLQDGVVRHHSSAEPAPLLLGFVLGHLIEENLRRAMLLSRGELSTFAENPLSLILLIVSAGLLAQSALPALRAKREEVFVED